jgi:hypothetical protein
MRVIKLARSPFALIGSAWDRYCIRQRLRWAEGDLAFLQRQTALDHHKLAQLRGHIAELRVLYATTR